jgi:N6-L-threonylcarbamoyladenine synthase
MKILGLETSCDETAAAIVADGSETLSNVLTSSLPLHVKTSGIIPEIAAREQVKAIVPVIDTALRESTVVKNRSSSNRDRVNYKLAIPDIDAIAVTFGPGLIGSLLVGVEAARTLSYVWGKPLVPVNHLISHFYSSWLDNPKPPKFPLVALIVSGGHTELLFVSDHGKYKHLGGTKDDAAGEAFDKIARLLGLGYPGGPVIEKASTSGNPGKFQLPRPLIDSTEYDFSFSGLKTAAVNLVGKLTSSDVKLTKQQVADLASCTQEAIADVLVTKTIRAARSFQVEAIVLGGGVAANKRLRERMSSSFNGAVYYSEPAYSIDNGAMVASAAYFNYKPVPWQKIKADPAILF